MKSLTIMRNVSSPNKTRSTSTSTTLQLGGSDFSIADIVIMCRLEGATLESLSIPSQQDAPLWTRVGGPALNLSFAGAVVDMRGGANKLYPLEAKKQFVVMAEYTI